MKCLTYYYGTPVYIESSDVGYINLYPFNSQEIKIIKKALKKNDGKDIILKKPNEEIENENFNKKTLIEQKEDKIKSLFYG